MLTKTKTHELKTNVADRGGYAVELAQDKKFRAHVSEAARHASEAWLRAQERQHPHRTRNRLFKLVLAGGAAAVAFVPSLRRSVTDRVSSLETPERLPGVPQTPRVIAESIEVDVPVRTAYDQWTQFEEFPRFMDGVEEVRQLDDTLLHWVSTVGGRRAEWDAKIVEQHPDRQITWVSEDGRTTRGTVSFEEVAPSKTRIELSMSYRTTGLRELAGSAAGIDARRVRGDLERFKTFIEERGTATGAWRGDVSAGSETTAGSMS
jgi:uncharacterized membrane protein